MTSDALIQVSSNRFMNGHDLMNKQRWLELHILPYKICWGTKNLNQRSHRHKSEQVKCTRGEQGHKTVVISPSLLWHNVETRTISTPLFFSFFFFFLPLLLSFLWKLFFGCRVVLSPCWLMQTLRFPSGAKTAHAQSSFNIYSSSLHPFLPQLLHTEKPQQRLCLMSSPLPLAHTKTTFNVIQAHWGSPGRTHFELNWSVSVGWLHICVFFFFFFRLTYVCLAFLLRLGDLHHSVYLQSGKKHMPGLCSWLLVSVWADFNYFNKFFS